MCRSSVFFFRTTNQNVFMSDPGLKSPPDLHQSSSLMPSSSILRYFFLFTVPQYSPSTASQFPSFCTNSPTPFSSVSLSSFSTPCLNPVLKFTNLQNVFNSSFSPLHYQETPPHSASSYTVLNIFCTPVGSFSLLLTLSTLRIQLHTCQHLSYLWSNFARPNCPIQFLSPARLSKPLGLIIVYNFEHYILVRLGDFFLLYGPAFIYPAMSTSPFNLLFPISTDFAFSSTRTTVGSRLLFP